MSHMITESELGCARTRGREKISSLVGEFRKDMDPLTRQLALKRLYGERVAPIQKAIDNFDLSNYRTREEDPEILRRLMLTSFQAVEEIDAICKLMAANRVDENTRAHYDVVQKFTDERKWNLCQAFHTFATEGKVEPKCPSDILSLVTKMARKGLFPLDILSGLMMPLRSATPENVP